MACRTDILWSDELLGYDFGAGHPMASARLDLTMGLSCALGLLDLPGVRVVGVEPAADDELRRVHGADYLAAVRAAGSERSCHPSPATRTPGARSASDFPVGETGASSPSWTQGWASTLRTYPPSPRPAPWRAARSRRTCRT